MQHQPQVRPPRGWGRACGLSWPAKRLGSRSEPHALQKPCACGMGLPPAHHPTPFRTPMHTSDHLLQPKHRTYHRYIAVPDQPPPPPDHSVRPQPPLHIPLQEKPGSMLPHPLQPLPPLRQNGVKLCCSGLFRHDAIPAPHQPYTCPAALERPEGVRNDGVHGRVPGNARLLVRRRLVRRRREVLPQQRGDGRMLRLDVLRLRLQRRDLGVQQVGALQLDAGQRVAAWGGECAGVGMRGRRGRGCGALCGAERTGQGVHAVF